tara:strand:+ start:224 stop:562 length:339 start_codon:yes stop_codon:yes gene_type:complete
MLIPKSPKIKNKKHLMFVASQNCCLTSVSADWCNGNVQAHHLLKPYVGKRGMGMKASDNNAVPLCYHHHAKLHDSNGDEDSFWVKFTLSEDFGREKAKYWWSISPYNKERFK